jgi:hypothetical protein
MHFNVSKRLLYNLCPSDCTAIDHMLVAIISVRKHLHKRVNPQRVLGRADSAFDHSVLGGDDHLPFGGCVDCTMSQHGAIERPSTMISSHPEPSLLASVDALSNSSLPHNPPRNRFQTQEGADVFGSHVSHL